MKRRLAAILAADVVGYTRLMGVDEAGTLRHLTELREQNLHPLIKRHRGRIFKLLGDGLLVEFASVVDAVACALAWQAKIIELEAERDKDQRIQFRIGINLGDVIVDGEDIHGDGVNIAARLEGLANPNGICISSDAYRQAKGRLEAEFEDLGQQNLKNVAEPVRVYRIAARPSAEAPCHQMAAHLPLPDKPSIAVLPFKNMSGDPEQEYFSDGITEDIITLVSRYRWLFVIARSSSFSYKHKTVDANVIAGELGVRYVLSGSVRRFKDRVRISTQLIDTEAGRHVWAERYDRTLEDVFNLQDEIAETIVGAIEPELIDAEHRRIARKSPESLDAWDYYQRGIHHLYKFTQDGFSAASQDFERSIRSDPTFPPAYAVLAETRFHEVLEGFANDPTTTLNDALRLAKQAVSMDRQDATGRFAVGRVQSLRRQYEDSVAELMAALELNPSYAQAHLGLGFTLTISGRMAEAIPHLDEAMRLSPRDPRLWSFMNVRAFAHLLAGEYEDALDWASHAARQPNAGHWTNAHVVAALGHLGRLDEAKVALEALLQRNPQFSCKFAREHRFYMRCPKAIEHYVDGLRKAGLPE